METKQVEYKVGQKIKIKNVPGMVHNHLKVKPPYEAEIIGVYKEEKKNRVLIRLDPAIFGDVSYAWKFWDNPGGTAVIDGKSIDQHVQYVTPSCFELIDARGRKEAKFKLDEQVKVNDQMVRILGYNVENGTYLIEATDGDKLTHEMIRKMDCFVGYETPGSNGNTSIRCKIVSEKDLLKENKIKMKTETEGESFVEKLKDDGTDAAYRVGARQMSRVVQSAILKMLQEKGYKKAQVSAIKEFLASELGEAFIKNLLGYALTYMPHISNDPRAQKLAKEFRVDGMAQIGNLAVEHLLPAVMGAFASLPALEESAAIERPMTQKVSAADFLTTKVVEVETVSAGAARQGRA